MNIVGKKFTHAEFKSYLASLGFTPWAKFIVVHNTSEPDIALYQSWMKRGNPTPEQWLKNLASYYAGKGWSGGPHLVIPPTPDTILVLNALSVPGVHTPSWNRISYGVETVGEFEHEEFSDPSRNNLVAALTLMHERFSLDPADYLLGAKGLHFHKEDKATTHRTCPGKNMVKADLINAVVNAMQQDRRGEPIAPDAHMHDVPIASQEVDASKLNTVEAISIYWLQAALNLWKPTLKLSVNGDANDPATIEAVKIFQMTSGIRIDGIPAGVTRVALKKATAA